MTKLSQALPIPLPTSFGGTGVATTVWSATSLALGGATIGTDALAWTGTATGSARLTIGGLTNTLNGSASVSPSLLTGTVLTGGSATTNFPAMFVQPTGTAAVTSWSTSGTGLGMNLASGFAGNFIDFHVAGAASVFSVTSAGSVTGASFIPTSATAPTYGIYAVAGTAVATVSANTGGNSVAEWYTGATRIGRLTGGSVLITQAGSATLNTQPYSGAAYIGGLAGGIQLGQGDTDLNSAIVAQTLRTQGALVGGTSNQAGKDFTVIVSPGKGTGAGGSFILQTAPAGSTGTALNAPVTALTIDSTGLATFASNVMTAAATAFQFGSTRSTISSSADGNILLRNAAATDFGLLLFGGTTSSFPALKRASGSIQFRLADDSAFADGNMNNLTIQASLTAGVYLGWASKSLMRSLVDSNITLTNAATTAFNLLQFGGTTSSFPAIKRSTTSLQARLSDDSAYTFMQAQLQTSVAATTGLTAGVLAALTNASIVIYDSTGQAYRVPCII